MKNKKIAILFFVVVFISAILGFYVSKSVATYMLLKDSNINLGVNKNGTVKVKSVEIEEGRGKNIHINNIKAFDNSNVAKLQLHANVYPANATNKNVVWSSSNEDIATVNQKGLVTIKKKLGKVNITVTTKDGNYKDTYKLIVKEKAIVVITASQGLRMEKWFNEYTYKNKYEFISTDNNYHKDLCITEDSPKPGNLIYVCNAGTGTNYQYKAGKDKNGDDYGLTATIKQLNKKYKGKEEYVDLTVFFTLSGNKIKDFSCKEINDPNVDEYKSYAKGFNDAIKTIKDTGYKNIKGIVMSHSPLNSIDSRQNHNRLDIVYSSDENACKAKAYIKVGDNKGNYKKQNGKFVKVEENKGNYNYTAIRSAYKYWLSNKRMEKELKEAKYDDLSFLNSFDNIVVLTKEDKKKETADFEWKKYNGECAEYDIAKDWKIGVSLRSIYKTTDGLHWNEASTKLYMKLAFDSAKLK